MAAPTRASRETLRAIVTELEQRIRQGERRSTESLVAAYPQIAGDKELMLELVYTEHVLRQELGEETPVDEWLRRFPEWRADLLQLFQVHEYLSEAPAAAADSAADAQAFQNWGDHSPNAASPRMGKYEVLESIGRGGMGVVYRARQFAPDRIVALKTLLHAGTGGADLRRRFRAEVDAVALLQHPHIVQIYDVGIDDDIPFFSMEYVSAGSLADVIRRHPIAPIAAARLMRCVARAIQYAHDQGVVHRDLKPANILLAPSQREEAVALEASSANQPSPMRFEPKITDFGLARRLDADSLGTLPGSTLGTPSYMAPEQVEQGAQPVGPACDIYSLGAVLYDMLVGRPPFLAATPLETLQQVKQDDPPSIRNVQPDVARDLELICLTCLRKEPMRRYRTAGALADDLDRFLTGRPIQARSAGWLERGLKWSRRHPAAAAFLTALILGSIGIFWQWMRAEGHRSRAESAQHVERLERERAESTLYARDVSLAYHEYLSNNTSRAMQLLQHCPAAMRGWEWDVLWEVCRPEHWDFAELRRPVYCTAISRDGRYVAGGCSSWGQNHQEQIKIWDVATGELKWTLVDHPSSIMDLSFSPDGTLLASAGNQWRQRKPPGGLRIWSVRDGTVVARDETLDALSLEFSPDGHWIAVGDDQGQVHLWNVQSGRFERSIQAHDNLVLDIDWSSDSRRIASCSRDGTARLYDLDGTSIHRWVGFNDARRIDIAPAGDQVAIGNYTGLIRIFTIGASQPMEVGRLALSSALGGMEYTPDGQSLVVSSIFDSIQLVDPLSGRVQREWHGHNGLCRDLGLNESGMILVSSGGDGHVRVWDVTRPEQPLESRRAGPHMIAAHYLDAERLAIGLGFNSDRPSLGYDSQSLRIWNMASGQVEHFALGHSSWLTSLAIDTNRKSLLTGSLDRTIRLWDIAEQRPIAVAGPLSHSVLQVALIDEGKLAVALEESGQLSVWKLPELTRLDASWPTTSSPISVVAGLNHRAALVFATEAGELLIGDLGGSENPARCHVGSAIRCLALSADDQWLAAGCLNGELLIWKLEGTGIALGAAPDLRIDAHSSSVEGIHFSPDGRRLFSAGPDTSLRIWDVATGQQVLKLDGPANDVSGVAISPDFNRVVVVNRTTLTEWNRIPPIRRGYSELIPDRAWSHRWYRQQLQRALSDRNHGAILFYLDRLGPELSRDEYPVSLRANSLASLQRHAEAIDAYQAIAVDTRSVLDESYLAVLCLACQRMAEFEASCQRLLNRVSPQSPPDEINRALWPAGLQRGAALELDRYAPLLDALLDDSSAPGHLNTAGAVYLRTGRLQEARQVLQRAMELRPGPEVCFDHILLAMVMERLGDHPSALEHLTLARATIEEQRHLARYRRPTHPFYTWDVQLELELLLAEAESLIAGD